MGLSLDNQTKTIDYLDISKKKKGEYDANIEKYISQGNKTIEEKKQKKKVKKEKEEEQWYKLFIITFLNAVVEVIVT